MSGRTSGICQSCSMPLQTPDDHGTDADGAASKEYCCFCYQNGRFSQPDISLDEMIEMVIDFMVDEAQMPIDQARLTAERTLPRLKRWKLSDGRNP